MPTPLTDAIQALTRYANETTGASDTTLSDAVATLVEGYGQGGGGGGSLFSGSFTPSENTSTVTISVGSPYNNVLVFSHSPVTGHDTKATSLLYFHNVSFSASDTKLLICVTTNNGGTSQSTFRTNFTGTEQSGGLYFIYNNCRTDFYADYTIKFKGSSSGTAYGYFVGGIKYSWFAWNDEGGGLPSEFVRLNYIQSTGTQYIDTGLYTKANQAYYIDARRISTNTTNFMGNNVSGCAMFLQNGSGGSDLYAQFGSANYVRVDTGDKDTARQIKIDINGYYKLNVATKEYDLLASFASSSVTENENVHNILFGRKTSGNPQLGSLMIFHFWCEEDGVKVRDMYPAMRLSDNELGMYDTVNDVFYTNDGTGSFLGGTTI